MPKIFQFTVKSSGFLNCLGLQFMCEACTQDLFYIRNFDLWFLVDGVSVSCLGFVVQWE